MRYILLTSILLACSSQDSKQITISKNDRRDILLERFSLLVNGCFNEEGVDTVNVQLFEQFAQSIKSKSKVFYKSSHNLIVLTPVNSILVISKFRADTLRVTSFKTQKEINNEDELLLCHNKFKEHRSKRIIGSEWNENNTMQSPGQNGQFKFSEIRAEALLKQKFILSQYYNGIKF